MGGPYSAGQLTLGDRIAKMNGDSGLRFIGMRIPIEADSANLMVAATAGNSANFAVGTNFPLQTNPQQMWPRSICCTVNTDATVQTRTATFRIFYEDQFGGTRFLDLSVSATASQVNQRNHTGDSTKVLPTTEIGGCIARIIGVQTIAKNANWVAGDNVQFGIVHDDALTAYALPLEIRNAADIRSLAIQTAFATFTKLTTAEQAAVVVDTSSMSIRNFPAAAAASTFIMVHARSSFGLS